MKENKADSNAQNPSDKDVDNKAKSWAKEWFDALWFAFIAALILRTFFFEAFKIPTPSMENTMMTGDFLIVSKMSYGPRTPMTVGVPFTNIYLPGVDIPWTRLPSLSEVERNDIVIFNYPIEIAPISQKSNYVKRCVGIPGDTLELVKKRLFVNNQPAERVETIVEQYLVRAKEDVRISTERIKDLGGKYIHQENPTEYTVLLTEAQANEMATWQEVEEIKQVILPANVNSFRNSRNKFNFSSGMTNHHNFPPMVVPFKGQKVKLTDSNWHLYQDIVERYERNTVKKSGNEFEINGEVTNEYTIQKDYYFMMGDNRDVSEDSRFWGFVPDDHIVGSPVFVYFSMDGYVPRFNRIFTFF